MEPRQPTGVLPGTSFSTVTVNRHMKPPQTAKGYEYDLDASGMKVIPSGKPPIPAELGEKGKGGLE